MDCKDHNVQKGKISKRGVLQKLEPTQINELCKKLWYEIVYIA